MDNSKLQMFDDFAAYGILNTNIIEYIAKQRLKNKEIKQEALGLINKYLTRVALDTCSAGKKCCDIAKMRRRENISGSWLFSINYLQILSIQDKLRQQNGNMVILNCDHFLKCLDSRDKEWWLYYNELTNLLRRDFQLCKTRINNTWKREITAGDIFCAFNKYSMVGRFRTDLKTVLSKRIVKFTPRNILDIPIGIEAISQKLYLMLRWLANNDYQLSIPMFITLFKNPRIDMSRQQCTTNMCIKSLYEQTDANFSMCREVFFYAFTHFDTQKDFETRMEMSEWRRNYESILIDAANQQK